VRILFHTCVILLLTVISQVGGVLWLLTVFLWKPLKKVRFRKVFFLCTFISLYAGFSIYCVPPLASHFYQRVPLPIRVKKGLKPRSPFFYCLNRHYVKRSVRAELIHLSQKIRSKFPGTITYYLDAGFPLFNNYPLLPHLSHRNGQNVDLSFYYEQKITGQQVPPPSYYRILDL